MKYKGVEMTEELDFQVRYHAEATLNVFTNWGRKGMQIPPETFTRYLCECVPRGLYKLLNEPADEKPKPIASLCPQSPQNL